MVRTTFQNKMDRQRMNPQNEKQATYADKVKKEEAEINWSHSAEEIINRFEPLIHGPGLTPKLILTVKRNG